MGSDHRGKDERETSMQALAFGRRRRGASLIEILVVIVVFTVGILTAVQVFPGGLTVLRANRSNTVANALARAEMERLKATVEQMPEAVLSAAYPFRGGFREIELDLQRRPGDFTPPATGLDRNGTLFDADGGLGNWALYSGANIGRVVVGEGRTIPSPRFIDGVGGTRFGGLLTLQFAPLYLDVFVNDPTLGRIPFVLYGNDLVRFIVDGVPANQRLRRDYTAFVDEDGLELTVPQGPFRPDLAPGAFSRNYRVSARVLFSNGGNLVAQDLVRVVRIPMPTAANAPRLNVPVDLGTLFADPSGTLTFERVEPDTVQVARLFDEVTTFFTEAQIQSSPNLLDDAVYQYQRVNDRLGMFLFHPQGAQYFERRGGQSRVPLRVRVDYNVLDWRLIRDEFRVPSDAPFQQKLILDSLKVLRDQDVDRRPYQGLGFPVPDGTGAQVATDFLVVDQDTGAVIAPNSYTVDKSLGVIRFIDVDGNLNNGLSADVIFQGRANADRVLDIRNRALRAVYMARGEFAVRPIKAVSRYRLTFSSTLGIGQAYVGGTDVSAPASLPTRIYFPLSDIGKKVVVGEIWYQAAGQRRNLVEQEFLIQAPAAGDWSRYAFIDIREKDPAATAFDFSFGYAAREVRGASVTVEVTWNPSFFTILEDPAENLRQLGIWLGQTRRVTTESFLMKGATP